MGAGSHEGGLAEVSIGLQVAAEDIVVGLGTIEICKIKSALLGWRRLNQIFDLLKVEYPDWPYPATNTEDAVARMMDLRGK
jgi:hypothetical protein